MSKKGMKLPIFTKRSLNNFKLEWFLENASLSRVHVMNWNEMNSGIRRFYKITEIQAKWFLVEIQ